MGGEDGQRPDPASPAAPGHSPAGPPAPKRINGGTPPPGNRPEAAGPGEGSRNVTHFPHRGVPPPSQPWAGGTQHPRGGGQASRLPTTPKQGARDHTRSRCTEARLSTPPPRVCVCVCVSPRRQSGSCAPRRTDRFTTPKTHPAWQEGKLRPAAQICIGLVPNEPWDITAGISQQAGSPRAGVRMGGTPGRGCQKPHQAQPGQGKELIPLLAGSQMATAPIPQLSRFKR